MLQWEKKYGKINSIVFSRAESDTINRRDETSITDNGLTEIKISNNQILESNDRENFIDGLFNYLDGFEYYLCDISTIGIIFLEIGDRYTIQIDDINYPTIMLNDDLMVTTGITENIYLDMPEITDTDYKTSSASDKAVKNAIIQVNKNNAEILLKVNSDGNVAQVRLDGDADDGSLVEIKADNINLEGYTTVNGNVKFNLDGTIEAINGKFSGDIFLSSGGKVIGGDGLLTILQVEGKCQWFWFKRTRY